MIISLYLSVGLLSCVEESPILSFPRKRSGIWANLNGTNSWPWLAKQSHAKVMFLFEPFPMSSKISFSWYFNSCTHIFAEHKRRLSPGPGNSHDMLPLSKDDWDTKQGVIEDAEQETPVSWKLWFWNSLRVKMKSL